MIVAGLFRRVFVPTAATLFALVPSYSEAAETKRWDCKGHAVNGYGRQSPNYKKFYDITHVVATSCPKNHLRNNKPCRFYLDSKVYNNTFYLGNGAVLSIGEDAFGDYFNGGFTPATGYLVYLISDGPLGTNQNETQRWFEGYCIERSP